MALHRKNQTTVNSTVCILLMCLIGLALSQTFQYSRGWANGKKRNGAPLILQEAGEGNDVLGICQMLRLREILAQKRRDQVYLPCEIIGKPEEEIMERFRRKTSEFDNASFDNGGNREQ